MQNADLQPTINVNCSTGQQRLMHTKVIGAQRALAYTKEPRMRKTLDELINRCSTNGWNAVLVSVTTE
jgi:hypothetical protein